MVCPLMLVQETPSSMTPIFSGTSDKVAWDAPLDPEGELAGIGLGSKLLDRPYLVGEGHSMATCWPLACEDTISTRPIWRQACAWMLRPRSRTKGQEARLQSTRQHLLARLSA
jgi:hypothetical protein